MSIRYYTLYTSNFRKMKKVYRIIIRKKGKKGKNHCRTKVQQHHAEESGRTADCVRLCTVYDEFVDPKLHLDHQDHQLIPKGSSSINHKAPSSFQGEEKGLIKNLPTLKVLKNLHTVLESTQTKGLVRVIIRKGNSISAEKKEKLTLKKDLEKAKNLDNIIRNIYHIKGRRDSPYREAMDASFIVPAKDDTSIPFVYF